MKETKSVWKCLTLWINLLQCFAYTVGCFERNNTQYYCNEFLQLESDGDDERNMAVRDLCALLQEFGGILDYDIQARSINMSRLNNGF